MKVEVWWKWLIAGAGLDSDVHRQKKQNATTES
jgi:hypothetical protein